ncbi:MAG TPA: CBS domain-containing protein [Nocardioidaceae bacterium]|nr:CBS domain-containing protein [Nocardioidaceae bacterium]
MIVKDVMTSPAITVDAGTTVKNALRLLDRYRVTSLPVTDAQGQVVGIVSEADLLRDLVRKDTRAHMLPPAQPSDQPRTVGQVMTTLSLAVCADTDLSDAVDLMTSTAVKSLPVLEQGRVVGVVSRSDVVRVLARADEQIEAEVDEILRSAGVECEVEVTDGVVSLTSLADPAQWRVAEVVAGSVAGVISVTVGTEPGGSAGDGHRPLQDGAVRFLR